MHRSDKRQGFGPRLRRARLAAGYAVAAEFARRVGCSPHTLWRYEEGLSRPGIDHLVSIGRVSGANVDWLVTGEGRGPDEAAA